MSLKLITSSIIAACFFSFQACINPPDYPNRPDIEFISISTQRAGEGNITVNDTGSILMIFNNESLVLKFGFKDGDGDIGYDLQGELPPCDSILCDRIACDLTFRNIFLTDSRKAGCAFPFTPYTAPYIPKKGSSDAISGDILIKILPLSCVPPKGGNIDDIPELDTLIFYVHLIDRAGNSSDTIRTPMIVIDCF